MNAATTLIRFIFENESRGLVELLEVIYGYGHFLPAEELMAAFATHFLTLTASSDKESNPHSDKNLIPVINFLKTWIKVEHHMFLTDETLVRLMNDFLRHVPAQWASIIEMSLQARDVHESDEESLAEVTPAIISRKPSKTALTVGSSLLDYDPEEIARQLVLIDLQHCRLVAPTEFLNVSWTKPDSKSTGLTECSKRANSVAYWISQQITTAPSKSKAKMVKHILLICQALLRLQNYQSLMAFYLGLNLSSVESLDVYAFLPKSIIEIWKDMKFLFDLSNNFRNYRYKTKSIALPYILCQEIILKDLLFLDESQENFLPIEGGSVLNQDKLITLGQIVHRFVLSQRCSYGLSTYPELCDYLRDEPHMATVLSFSEASVDGAEPILQLKDAYTSPSLSQTNSHASSFDDSTNSFLEDNPKSLSGSRSSVNSPRRSSKFATLKTLYGLPVAW